MAVVALVCRGDARDPASWSGVLAGVRHGLEACGHAVRPVNVEVPVVSELLHRKLPSGRLAAARSAAAGVQVASSRADVVLQIGTEFGFRTRRPLGVLFDMTLAQGRGLGDGFVLAQPPGVLAAWERRHRRIFRRADFLLAASSWAAGSAREDYGADPSRVHVVGFGRNHSPPAGERDWIRPRFLFVGREWERKGGPELLEAFAEVRRRRPDTKLDVVGGHPPIDQPGVAAHGPLRLQVPEERARLERLFAAATCFVMPSRYEAFGIAYAEAAAAGIPSIGSTIGGAAEVLGGESGRLVPPGDVPALGAAMEALADPDTARRMGAAARRRAELLTWERTAARIGHAFGLAVPEGWAAAL